MVWDDEDLDYDVQTAPHKFEEQVRQRNLPVFRMWYEQWEMDLQKDQCEFAKTRFETKYLGIKFYEEIDEEEILCEVDEIFWNDSRKKDEVKGWNASFVDKNED